MTDKELLELAAKAAGIEVQEWRESYEAFKMKEPMLYWNPLTDDGDALRLAVKLKILVVINKFSSSATDGSFDMENTETYHEDYDDSYTATRRAIVVAAAEIGKTL